MENFEIVFFFELKPLISLSNFNILSSPFFANVHIFRIEKNSAIEKKLGNGSAGVVIFEDTTLRGARMRVPSERFSKFLVRYFLNVFI